MKPCAGCHGYARPGVKQAPVSVMLIFAAGLATNAQEQMSWRVAMVVALIHLLLSPDQETTREKKSDSVRCIRTIIFVRRCVIYARINL